MLYQGGDRSGKNTVKKKEETPIFSDGNFRIVLNDK